MNPSDMTQKHPTPTDFQRLLQKRLATIGGVLEFFDAPVPPNGSKIETPDARRLMRVELSHKSWGWAPSIIGTSTMRWNLSGGWPDATGAMQWCRLYTSDRMMWLDLTVGKSGSSADFRFDNVCVAKGIEHALERYSLTFPWVVDGAEGFQGPPKAPAKREPKKRAAKVRKGMLVEGDVHDSDRNAMAGGDGVAGGVDQKVDE